MPATEATFTSSRSALIAVLDIATHELRELQSRHDELTRRIRSVRSAVHALCRLSARPIQSPQCLDQNRVGDTAPRSDEGLIRACRIALLETDEPLSVDDIYSRIVRRGSFLVSDAASCKPSIAQHLEAMARHGEVLRIPSASQMKWQRI